MNQVLLDQEDGTIFTRYGIPALTKFQFHMILQIDDTTLFFSQHYGEFCLKGKLNWAKNVNEECEAPFQTIIASMNQQYCVFIALAIWLVVSLTEMLWAAASPYVFSFKNNMRMPEGTTKAKAFTRKILHQFFKDREEFAKTKAGSHSVCKYSSSTAQNKG
jgi:hypothetical protein